MFDRRHFQIIFYISTWMQRNQIDIHTVIVCFQIVKIGGEKFMHCVHQLHMHCVATFTV